MLYQGRSSKELVWFCKRKVSEIPKQGKQKIDMYINIYQYIYIFIPRKSKLPNLCVCFFKLNCRYSYIVLLETQRQIKNLENNRSTIWVYR